MTCQALHIEKDDAGYRCALKTLDDSALPERSMPGVSGNLRTTGLLPVMARPSL